MSAGCDFCYAEKMSHRNPKVLGVWGDDGTRVIASEAKWKEPLKWNRKAREAGERRRVFCASIADVFEDRPELEPHRARLFGLVVATPRLDWLILTKRPGRMAMYFRSRSRMWEAAQAYRDLVYGRDSGVGLGDGLAHWPPRNVWAGTSIEDQAAADERIPDLLSTPATVRFLSVEPLLGPVSLDGILRCPGELETATTTFDPAGYNPEDCAGCGAPKSAHIRSGIHWVIVGGESGPKARPMHPMWARSIRDQCVASKVPYFFKQWGEWGPIDDDTPSGSRLVFLHADGGVTPAASPYEPGCPCDSSLREAEMVRVGKKAAGRLLDGVEWSQFPEVARCE